MNKLRPLVYRLGGEPNKSWSWFFRGLALFIIGLIPLLTIHNLLWLDYLGLGMLLLGFGMAVKGYVGIFANRWAQVLNRAASAPWPDNKNDRPD